MRVLSGNGADSCDPVELLRCTGKCRRIVMHTCKGRTLIPSYGQSASQRVYAMMVRIHDVYRMHSIFIHGFPGLLECFYVQERLIESLMPDVYVSMVSRA
jgi:hypothetical protein